MVMRRISGVLREFRRVCPRLFCGGLCMSFIRRAYLHTTSSVLVPRATVTAVSAIRRTLCPLHAYLRSYVSNGCCTYLCVPTPVRGVCLRTQAECGACNQYVRPVFVL
jgi:hypothetical protein